MVELMYVLSILEDDMTRKKDLLEKFIEVVVGNADHLQPGYELKYNQKLH